LIEVWGGGERWDALLLLMVSVRVLVGISVGVSLKNHRIIPSEGGDGVKGGVVPPHRHHMRRGGWVEREVVELGRRAEARWIGREGRDVVKV